MRSTKARLIGVLLMGALALPAPAPATDVDGPNDCQRAPIDFGDAPEGSLAYPAVPGRFPTCLVAGPVGTRTVACAPISTLPGAAGFVRHVHPTGGGYWLGCPVTGFPPQGIDPELDGKMNSTGGAFSVCNTTIAIDCVEAAFGMSFGQDECYGSTDACLASPVSFTPCTPSSVTFTSYNCLQTRQVYLNILVDWNQDGDWNDNYQCVGSCAYEWAVKNVLIALAPGCNTVTSPIFTSGPNFGDGWMRITISDQPVNDDFPWAGVATMPVQQLNDGETEDYPITIQHPQECPDYEDWGDAPEEVQAYPGVPGRFPTCAFATPPGTRELSCPPISTVPGPTGFVRHVSAAVDPFQFWLGCGDLAVGAPGVDSEINGKTNDTGGPISICASGVPIDCVEAAFGLSFGQDECYGDGVDAGVDPAFITLQACSTAVVNFKTFNCKNTVDAYLNILVDYNQDGDWNDNFDCGSPTNPICAYEWAVKNVPITLLPGCQPQVSPSFRVGPNAGNGWLRITLTYSPVTDDFPWDGSAGGPAGQGFFRGGETEDYPVTITGPCQIGYKDFGDAPEAVIAYTTGILGRFPTCIAPTAAGDFDSDPECPPPLGTPPALTGYVEHLAMPADPTHFWLGCGLPGSPALAIDSEIDGKMNGTGASISRCNDAQLVDCVEAMGPLVFGQDECYGDLDASLGSYVSFARCSTGTVPFRAYNCTDVNTSVYLNLLVDWNQDGDWNDMDLCFQGKLCAPEWAVKNKPIGLAPGCNGLVTPSFQVGPQQGDAWMRLTISTEPAPDDFPWNGSISLPGSVFHGGETEDYPVTITPSTVSVGDLPESGQLWLGPIVPNPARSGIVVRYQLPRDADVSLVAYDLAGRKLAELKRGHMPAGQHLAQWDFRDAGGTDVGAGYYVLKLRVGDRVETQRGVRIR